METAGFIFRICARIEGDAAADGSAVEDGHGALAQTAVHEQCAVRDSRRAGEIVRVVEGERSTAGLVQRHRAIERAAAAEGVILCRIEGHGRGLKRASQLNRRVG